MPKHRIQGSPQTVKIMSNSQRISQIVGQIVKTQGNGSIYAFSGFDDISRTVYLIARGPEVGSGPERNNPKLQSAKVDSGPERNYPKIQSAKVDSGPDPTFPTLSHGAMAQIRKEFPRGNSFP